MINTKLIREHMAKERYGVRGLSAAIGISEASLGNKLAGRTEFCADEIESMIKLLRLSPREVIACFFAEKVD